MKIGLEKEFFLIQKGVPLLVPFEIPHDGCGLLAEARGLPCTNGLEAVYSLLADIERVRALAAEHSKGAVLVDLPWVKVPKALMLERARVYTKGLDCQQNIHGFKCHANPAGSITAGLHVSITVQSVRNVGKVEVEYNRVWDFCRAFRELDKAFEGEIRSARRKPGFYEVKPDGRVEYRSLPANVNLHKLASVLAKIG